jgi:Heterokaryon incompatibility protein (HET)
VETLYGSKSSNLWGPIVRGEFMENPADWQYFWIDALCVDQTSICERNRQVAIMGQIFSNAAFVLAWLGAEADDSALVMRMLEERRWTDEYTCRMLKWAFRQLMGRPYSNRIWAVQEFLLARDVVIHCGYQRLSWRNLKACMNTRIQYMHIPSCLIPS